MSARLRAPAAGIAALLPGLLLAVLALSAAAAPPALSEVVIETAGGALLRYEVELAATPQARTRGLMFRRTLAPGHGMLFDFLEPQPVTMWMADTYLALDMVFIDGEGRVQRIVADTVPLSRAFIDSGGPVRAVLELPAGTAAHGGMAPGDRVRHPLFGDDAGSGGSRP